MFVNLFVRANPLTNRSGCLAANWPDLFVRHPPAKLQAARLQAARLQAPGCQAVSAESPDSPAEPIILRFLFWSVAILTQAFFCFLSGHRLQLSAMDCNPELVRWWKGEVVVVEWRAAEAARREARREARMVRRVAKAARREARAQRRAERAAVATWNTMMEPFGH